MYFPTSTIEACFLCAAPKASNMKVSNGFARLNELPEWYQYTLGVIVAASFGVRSASKFFGRKK